MPLCSSSRGRGSEARQDARASRCVRVLGARRRGTRPWGRGDARQDHREQQPTGGEDGGTARHRLEHGQAETLVPAREEQQ